MSARKGAELGQTGRFWWGARKQAKMQTFVANGKIGANKMANCARVFASEM